MRTTYLKSTWRHIMHSKGYSALNILGLSAGMAVALVIALWVYYECSYDRFLPGYEQAYQIHQNARIDGEIRTFGSGSLAMADAVRRDFPEVAYVAETDWNGAHSVVAGERKLSMNGTMAGSDFLKIFPFPMKEGQGEAALNNPYSIVLTESSAKALFGEEDPMGKTVRLDNAHDLTVTGVARDIPGNASFQFAFLVPFSYYEASNNGVKADRASGSWDENSYKIYVRLKPGIAYGQIAPKLRNLIKHYNPKAESEIMMQPMKDWHLYTDFENGQAVGGFIKFVRIFAFVGLLIWGIACINFVNLSTARSEKRAKEVGIRKSIGSSRGQLIAQFLVESVFLAVLAFVIALFWVRISLPSFNQMAAVNMALPFNQPLFWAIALIGVLVTGLAAGARPAFYLSSFRPSRVLKGSVRLGRAGTLPRKVLVVLQFSCSVALIIMTLVIYRQVRYVQQRPVGYSVDRLMMTDMSSDLRKNYAALKNDLLHSGLVTGVTMSTSPASEVYWHTIVESWPGKVEGESPLVGAMVVGDDYIQTMSMHMAEGRDFVGSSDSNAILMNEAAVKLLRLKEPLNQRITWAGGRADRVVGVVKDALLESPFARPSPLLIRYGATSGSFLLYRLAPGVGTEQAIQQLTPLFNHYNPGFPYVYAFADQSYATKFEMELLVGRLAGLFAVLAILISCLGLFGLAAYMAEQRTKEIGIRKVLGASVGQLWMLLSKDYLVLVGLSCLIATPVALYFANRWLEQYPDYRIHIGAGICLTAGLGALFITVLTVGFQSVRAALADPVKNLRTE